MTVAEPIYYVGIPYTPMPRRARLGRWVWVITDSQTGQDLASGAAWSLGAALRARISAEVSCRSEQEHLDDICRQLLAEGLPVAARFDERHRVCVTPACACSDVDHRRVMRAFLAVTSAVVWEVAR